MFRFAITAAWHIIRDRWLPLLVLLVLFYFPVDFVQAHIDHAYFNHDADTASWAQIGHDLRGSFRVSRLLHLWVLTLPDLAIMYLAYCYLAGTPATLGEAVHTAFTSYWRLWWTRVLGGFCILTLLLLVLPGVFMLTRWSMAEVFVVTSDEYGTTAMRRSWEMVRGRTWKVLFTLLAGGALYCVLLLPGMVLGIVVSVVWPDSVWLDGLSDVLMSLAEPFWLCFVVGLFAHLQATNGTNADAPAPANQPPPLPQALL